MAINPSSYDVFYDEHCYGSVGENGFDSVVEDNMSESFELSPNYEPIYIVKNSPTEQEFLHDTSLENSYGLPHYKSWIYDGTEDRQVVGRKYIQMYPYRPPILEQGDYVCWDYHKRGIKSTWLCFALDTQTIYEQIGGIRLCTNEMRFYNKNGELIRVPCVFDDAVNSEKNITLSDMKYINGITTVFMQLNSDSTQIKENQRFLFGRPGSWTSFRVVSVGVNNFMNQIFFDNTTSHILEITMEGSYVNEQTDDIVNGIADAVVFDVSIDTGDIANVAGTTEQLYATVYKNKELYGNDVIWYSSDETVATVTASGLLTLIADGTAKIGAKMANNTSSFSEITVVVSATAVDNLDVLISPYAEDGFGILQGNEQVFSCYLYKNGEKQPDVFTFSVDTGIPEKKFSYRVVDGNHFSVLNNMMDSYGNLSVKCESGIYAKDAVVVLKGAW